MKKPLQTAVAVLLASISGLGSTLVVAEESPKTLADHRFQPQLTKLVEEHREAKKLIGLAAMVMVDGKVVASAVDGKRKKGADVALTSEDRFHLGSITKSFTATVIGKLIERKELDWSTTVGECFGDTLDVHPDWKKVTVEQLLTHTSGAPANFFFTVLLERPAEDKLVAARRKAVGGVLKNKPQGKPGESFAYSNVGFTIAGAIAEIKTGKSWESLIRQEIWRPLNLKNAGFGPPKDNEGKPLSQPHGHQHLSLFKRVAGQDEDNTPIMGPAGTIHMTMADLCRYGNEHLQGERGKGVLLQAPTYKRLHTAKLKNYACGWVAPEDDQLAKGRMIWHNGSNRMWFALLALLPDQDAVVVVVANDGDVKGAQAAGFDIVNAFSKQELP